MQGTRDRLSTAEKLAREGTLAVASLALVAWLSVGTLYPTGLVSGESDPLSEVRAGAFPETPGGVRLLHWSRGHRAVSLAKVSALDVPTGPESLAMLPDGRLLVCCSRAQVAALVDTAKLKVVAQVPTGAGAVACCTTGNGQIAWLAAAGANKVVAVDLGAGKAVAEAACGKSPEAVAASPDGGRVLVANWGSGDVTVIDAARAEPLGSVAVGPHPRGIVCHPSKPYAYVSLNGSDKLVKLNWRDMRAEGSITCGRAPRHLVASPDGDTLYVAQNTPPQVAKVDRDDALVRATCFLSKGQPRTILLGPNGTDLFIANSGAGQVTIVDTNRMSESATAQTDVMPDGLALSEDGRRLYVAHSAVSSIWVFEVGYE
jgi:YVTN family beta-propeller protein